MIVPISKWWHRHTHCQLAHYLVAAVVVFFNSCHYIIMKGIVSIPEIRVVWNFWEFIQWGGGVERGNIFTTQVEIQGIMRVWMMMLLHLSCFFSPSKLPPPHVGDDLGHGVQIGLQKVTPCCVGKYLPKIGNDSQSA